MSATRVDVWRLRALLGVFFVSGFCGLIYESIWSHYLKLILGHAAHAQAVVLVVFVGGMAAGAALTSRFSERLRSPVLVYAVAEAFVALVGFGFHLLFIFTADWALESLLPAVCEPGALCWANWAVAAVLILPPSIALGATFPLMSAGVLRLGLSPGRGLALLYFLNSAGAAIGVLASGYWLIPEFGLPGTLLVAGACNVAVALAAWIAVRWGEPPEIPAPRVTMTREDRRMVPWLLAIAAFTGLASFIYEIAWIRMLTLVLGAATHSFELMLASFILGLALGGGWIRNRIDAPGANPRRMLAWVQVVMGVLAVATLPLYAWSFEGMALLLRSLARTEEAWLVFNLACALITMAVMLPATFCAGMTLPLITAVLLRQGGGERRIGQVYGMNTLGSIAGVLVAANVLMPAIGVKWTLAAGACVDVALGLVLLWRMPGAGGVTGASPAVPPRLSLTAACTAALAALACLAVPTLTELDPARLASGVFRSGRPQINASQEVIFHRDGRTATITVLRGRDGATALLTNGKSDGESHPQRKHTTLDDRTTTLLGALGPLHHPQARDVAVVGLGTGITTATVLKAESVRSVDTIEIEPMMVEAARHFRPSNNAVFTDPRSRIVIDDARAFFAKSARRYDLIISEPSNPWVSGVSGLFTMEFYARAASQLAADGLFVQWLHLYEASPQLVSSIIRAFSRIFPEFRVYASNGGDVILVGRADGRVTPPVSADAMRGALGEQLRWIGIDSPAMLAAHEIGRGSFIKLLFDGYGAPPNTDFFPYVDNRAAQDRFMKANAVLMQQIHLAPVPVLEFGRTANEAAGRVTTAQTDMPARVRDFASAYHLRRYLRGETLGNTELAYFGSQLRDHEITRNWLWNCQARTMQPTLWDSVLLAAGEINNGLPPDMASEVWRAVLNGPCRSRLSTLQSQWIRLFEAVARRDAEDTLPLAVALLRERTRSGGWLSAAQHEYLVVAAVTAHLALGANDEARTLFLAEGEVIPSERLERPWMRYLTLVLSARANPPAPGTPAAVAKRSTPAASVPRAGELWRSGTHAPPPAAPASSPAR